MHEYQKCSYCQKLFPEEQLARQNARLFCEDCQQESEFYNAVDAAEQEWYLENSDSASG